jgi:hypothetical protein
MHALLETLTTLGAANPGPQVGPALPAPARVGPVGEWFLPALIIGIALLIDATALGAAAKRDRFAAAMTYTGTIGFIGVYGWANDIQGWLGDTWSWRVAGSAVSVLAHAALVIVLVGDRIDRTKRLNAWLSGRVGVAAGGSGGQPRTGASAAGGATTTASSGNVGKINTKLHLWAAAAACTYVLARGDAAAIPRAIGTTLTTASGALGMWIVARLGG